MSGPDRDHKGKTIGKIISLANRMNSGSRMVVLAAMVIMTPVIFANVISRYVFNYSLAWSSEVSRYSFVWITFLGTAVALREDSHAKIDLFLEKAPGRLKTYLILIKYSLMLALSALLIVTGTNHVISIWYTKAAYMRFLSMGWMYLSIPLCGLLMLLFSFVSVLELFSQRGREQ